MPNYLKVEQRKEFKHILILFGFHDLTTGISITESFGTPFIEYVIKGIKSNVLSKLSLLHNILISKETSTVKFIDLDSCFHQ